jgi:hypothetical protein
MAGTRYGAAATRDARAEGGDSPVATAHATRDEPAGTHPRAVDAPGTAIAGRRDVADCALGSSSSSKLNHVDRRGGEIKNGLVAHSYPRPTPGRNDPARTLRPIHSRRATVRSLARSAEYIPSDRARQAVRSLGHSYQVKRRNNRTAPGDPHPRPRSDGVSTSRGLRFIRGGFAHQTCTVQPIERVNAVRTASPCARARPPGAPARARRRPPPRRLPRRGRHA